MLRLTIIDEDGRTVVVPLNHDEITIGRKEGNLIQLSERNISRHHAILTKDNDICFIDDLDSYNGVILNGQRIGSKSQVDPGDIIELGDYKIRLEDVEEDRVDLVQNEILYASETSDLPYIEETPEYQNNHHHPNSIFENVELKKVRTRERPNHSFAVQSAIIDNSAIEYQNGKTKWVVSFFVLLLIFGGILWFLPSAKTPDETQKDQQNEPQKQQKQAVLPEENAEPSETDTATENGDNEFRQELIADSISRATEKFDNEEYKQAEKILSTLLADIPDAKQAAQLRDKVRLERKNHVNYTNGLKALQKKNAFQALTLLGGISKRSRYHEPAQNAYNQARKTLIKDYVKKSSSYYKRKKYQKAYDWANNALNIDSTNQKAQKLLQDSKQKLTEKAKSNLSAKSYYNIATDYYNKTQYDQALEMFRKVLSIDKNFAYAWRGIGACLARGGKMEEASNAYRKYLQLKPDAPDKTEIIGMIKEYEDHQK